MVWFFSFEAHVSPSEQHSPASFLLHSWAPSVPGSALQVLASPEQHLFPCEQHLLSVDGAANGHPPAEQAFSSPSVLIDANAAREGHSPPGATGYFTDGFVVAATRFSNGQRDCRLLALAFEQHEPPEEAAETPFNPLSEPLKTPFCVRRIPAATAKLKANVTGKRARIMFAPNVELRDSFCSVGVSGRPSSRCNWHFPCIWENSSGSFRKSRACKRHGIHKH